ncbi:MAG TPA: type II secretion system protein [Thermohalobaculum sp.]|nr:type II secretion system protein [Thermohalobaculum sp.]
MSRSPPRRRERGFTLVEVLAAFVILSLTLASAYAALTGGLRWERRAGETVSSVLLARSYLAEAGVARPLAESVTEATLDDGRTVRVTMREVEPVPLETRPRLLAWEVTVEVVQPGGGALSLTELKLAPP